VDAAKLAETQLADLKSQLEALWTEKDATARTQHDELAALQVRPYVASSPALFPHGPPFYALPS
jgi:hypothetical protein